MVPCTVVGPRDQLTSELVPNEALSANIQVLLMCAVGPAKSTSELRIPEE
jgi:hypothetical protein